MLIAGNIESIHETIGFDDHSVKVGSIGLGDGQFHAGVGATESGVGGRDIDGVKLVGGGGNITDTVELVTTAEEAGVVNARDNELVDTTIENGCGRLIPVVSAVGMTPTVETAVGSSIKVENTILIDIVESMYRPKIVVIGVGDELEGDGCGVVTIDTYTFNGHFVVGGAISIIVVTSTDIDDIVGSLNHAINGE